MEFWTFSGINSPLNDAGTRHVDYTWDHIRDHISGHVPDRQYASQLGTGSMYDRDHNVLTLRSEDMLDEEAHDYATNGGGFPPIPVGAFKNKSLKVMLVAPKTTTRPPCPEGLLIEIYWNPDDYVPNQSIIHPDSLTYWREFERGGGRVWPVENDLGSGFGFGHDFQGFAVENPRIVKRVKIENPGSRIDRYRWLPTDDHAPSPMATLQDWLDDGDNDFVLLGHSQGANIIMAFIERGYS